MGHTSERLATIPTPPGSRSSPLADAETGAEILEQGGGKALGEDVREMTPAWNMHYPELAESDLLANEMNVQLDVFGPPMMDEVAGHVDARDVVTIRYCGFGDATAELAK